MRPAPRLRAALLFVLAALVACDSGEGLPEPPLLLAVSPSQGGTDAEVEVSLSGRNFQPHVETDFAASGGALDGTFAARLVPTAGGADVELREVLRVSPELLTARVPEGLEAGAYDVVVVAPSDTEVKLESAYRVRGEAGSVATFRFSLASLQRVGVPFSVSLTAEDARGQTVDGFTGTVRLSDRTGSLTPVLAGPFSGGRARVLVRVDTPLGDNRLRVEDDLGHASESEPFEVRNGLPAQVFWASGALSPVTGACSGPLELEVRDTLGAPADVEAPLAVTVITDPPEDFTLFVDATCTTAVPDGRLSLTGVRTSAYFVARREGPLELHVLPDTLPGDSQLHTAIPAAALPSSPGGTNPEEGSALGTTAARQEARLAP
jgi:hypothetical protein